MLIQYWRQKRDACLTEDRSVLYRRCQAGGEGLFTCSLNELNRNLNFVKEEFGNPQRLGYVLVVCIRFSELILVSAYLQVLARGVGV